MMRELSIAAWGTPLTASDQFSCFATITPNHQLPANLRLIASQSLLWVLRFSASRAAISPFTEERPSRAAILRHVLQDAPHLKTRAFESVVSSRRSLCCVAAKASACWQSRAILTLLRPSPPHTFQRRKRCEQWQVRRMLHPTDMAKAVLTLPPVSPWARIPPLELAFLLRSL